MSISKQNTAPKKQDTETVKTAENMAQMLKAVAPPLRLRIVAILSDQPEHVTGLSMRLDVQQPLVSQQLSILRLSGLVESKRLNGYTYYQLAIPELKELMRCIGRCCKS